MSDLLHWGNEGRIPLEDALRLNLPARSCSTYKLDVGGETYIGMSTIDPLIAAENHVRAAKDGEQTKLHKVLRRFGYQYEQTILSEHVNEVSCLVAKVGAIQRIKPTLNSTIGGEGVDFDLVELPNKFGEFALFVENKNVRKKLALARYKTSVNYLSSTIKKLDHRFEKLENKLPAERTFLADELFKLTPPLISLYSHSSERMSVYKYAKHRSERYTLLRNWSSDLQKIADERLPLREFADKCGLTVLKKGPAGMIGYMTIGGKNKSYKPTFKDDFFNPEYFIGAERVFMLNENNLKSSRVFDDEYEAYKWLAHQAWFEQGVKNGVIKLGDVFFPFQIYCGMYGGFLGLFRKIDSRLGFVFFNPLKT